MREVTLVVGARHMGTAAIQACLTLTAGAPLILIREPHNPHDGNAIRLHRITGEPVGYVQREVAAIVRQWIDIGMAVSAKVIRGPNLRNGRITMKKRYPKAVIYAEPPAEEGLSTGVRENVKHRSKVPSL